MSWELNACRNAKTGFVQSRETGVDRGDGIFPALLLVIDKVPGAVRNDGAAEASAELLEDVDGAGEAVFLVDGVVRSGSGIAVVVEAAAVDSVTAGARDHVHKASRCSAVIRSIRGHGHLELLDGILAKDVRNFFAAAGVAEIIAGGAGAVHGKRVGAVAVGVARILATLFAGEAHQTRIAVGRGIGNKQREIEEPPSAQGQTIKEIAIHHGTLVGVFCPQQRGLADYSNRLATRSRLEADIHRGRLPDLHIDS